MRKIVSLTALLSFLATILTSLILYITPHGRVAYWSDWRLFGLSKDDWGSLHLNLGVLFLLSLCLHLYYNWRPVMSYLKDKNREMKVFTREFNWALGLVLVFALGSYFNIPPLSWIPELSEEIKVAASRTYGEPPYGHAELSKLGILARRVGLDPAQALEKLKQADYEVKSLDQTLKEIADQNKITPKEAYAAIKPSGLPDSPPAGFGMNTLSGICADYGLDLDRMTKELAGLGVEIPPDKPLKEAAAALGLDGFVLYEKIKKAASQLEDTARVPGLGQGRKEGRRAGLHLRGQGSGSGPGFGHAGRGKNRY